MGQTLHNSFKAISTMDRLTVLRHVSNHAGGIYTKALSIDCHLHYSKTFRILLELSISGFVVNRDGLYTVNKKTLDNIIESLKELRNGKNT